MSFYKNPSIQAQSRQQSCFKSIILAPGRKKNYNKISKRSVEDGAEVRGLDPQHKGMKTLVGEMGGGEPRLSQRGEGGERRGAMFTASMLTQEAWE